MPEMVPVWASKVRPVGSVPMESKGSYTSRIAGWWHGDRVTERLTRVKKCGARAGDDGQRSIVGKGQLQCGGRSKTSVRDCKCHK